MFRQTALVFKLKGISVLIGITPKWWYRSMSLGLRFLYIKRKINVKIASFLLYKGMVNSLLKLYISPLRLEMSQCCHVNIVIEVISIRNVWGDRVVPRMEARTCLNSQSPSRHCTCTILDCLIFSVLLVSFFWMPWAHLYGWSLADMCFEWV